MWWLPPVIPVLSRLTPRQPRWWALGGLGEHRHVQYRCGGEGAWAFEGTDRLLSQLEAGKELII